MNIREALRGPSMGLETQRAAADEIAKLDKELSQLKSASSRLAEALEMAKNGLLWYQDRLPAEVNGCDDEALAQIDAALAGVAG